MSAPRVVLVGPLPPPAGGMANQTQQLARLLAEAGCSVDVVQTNRAAPIGWVDRVRFLRAVVRLVPYLSRLFDAMRGADVAHVMANSGLAWHLFAAPAIWIAALRGVPAVVNYRGGNAAAFLDRQGWIVRPTLRRATVLVVPSGFLSDVFARHGLTAEIVPNVVDLDAFRPSRVHSNGVHLVVTRNLEAIYDVGTAIRAFARARAVHPRATMTIAGSGPERQPLEALAKELEVTDAIRFTGRLDHDDLPRLYQEATVVVNASRIDNMPNSLLEALASGVPIVSTNVGGIPYLVEDGVTALLVPPGDAGAMAAAVLRLVDAPDFADRLCANGLAHAAQFAWPSVRPQLFDVYNRVRTRSSP